MYAEIKLLRLKKKKVKKRNDFKQITNFAQIFFVLAKSSSMLSLRRFCGETKFCSCRNGSRMLSFERPALFSGGDAGRTGVREFDSVRPSWRSGRETLIGDGRTTFRSGGGFSIDRPASLSGVRNGILNLDREPCSGEILV